MFAGDAFDVGLDYRWFAWLKDGMDIDNTLIEGRFGVLFLFVFCSSADVAVDIISDLDCWFMDVYDRLGVRAAVVAGVMLVLNVGRRMPIMMLV